MNQFLIEQYNETRNLKHGQKREQRKTIYKNL